MTYTIIANFKMNGSVASTIDYGNALFDLLYENELYHTKIVLAPCALHLAYLQSRLMGTKVQYSAQDVCAQAQSGPYTGDISAAQLVDSSCHYSLIGHSERRQNMAETNYIVSKKMLNTIAAELIPILCIGETFSENQAGNTLAVIEDQLTINLSNFKLSAKCIIAYEPVWSIGSGKTPTSQSIQKVFDYIINFISKHAIQADLIYGGSVNSQNVMDLLTIKYLSGFLVGGASLKTDTFWPIVTACEAKGLNGNSLN